jgi:GT2 family glycosyltransferase
MLTIPNQNLVVSFVISTWNRREVLTNTLTQIMRIGLHRDHFEVFVVDNNSSDGTPDAIERKFPQVRVLRMNQNYGACAKNFAIPQTRGRYVVFLDDDSYPTPGSIQGMIRHFESDARLGAISFAAILPDGSEECSAYPDVFIGCGVGFRRRALVEVGGLPGDYFMQAEEYDLSLRLLDAGWDVRTIDELTVMHLKTPSARMTGRTMRLDVRNNLILAARYFPDDWVGSFVRDWLRRYWWMASDRSHRLDFILGLVDGAIRLLVEPIRRPVSSATFERFAKIVEIENRLRRAREEHGFESVLFIDAGKNLFPFHLAAKACGLRVVAIADNRLASPGRSYRGIPVVHDHVAKELPFDAAIVSNLSRVHARQRAQSWERLDDRPILDLFARPTVATTFAARVAAQSHQTAARIA